MIEAKRFLDIYDGFINSVISMDKYVNKFIHSKDLYNIMKTTRYSDESAVEFVLSFLTISEKEVKSIEETDFIEKANEFMERDEKLEYFFKNIKSENDKFVTDNYYIKSLFDKINEENKIIANEIQQLKNNQIKNLVSAFESLVSNLFVHQFKYHQDPNVFNKENINFKDISHITDIKDIEDFVIDQKVISIMYKSFNSWVTKYCDDFVQGGSKKINKDFSNELELLNEVFERRHILTHNNGIINHLYLSKTASNILEKDIKVGNKVEVTNEYIDKTTDLVLYFGTILFLNSSKFKNVLKHDDLKNHINLIGLKLIENEKFSVAEYLFDLLFNQNSDEEIFFYNLWLAKVLDNNDIDKKELNEYIRNKDKLEVSDALALCIFNKEGYIKFLEGFLSTKDYDFKVHILRMPIFKIIENENDFIEFYNKNLYT